MTEGMAVSPAEVDRLLDQIPAASQPALDKAWGIPAHSKGLEAPAEPAADAVFYSLPLAMLHFSLDVLVYNQYGQSIDWPAIGNRFLGALAVLAILVYGLHTAAAMRHPLLRQLLFSVLAVGAGGALASSTNRHGYFAVMKSAPPIGTLCVWAVIELDVVPATASLLALGSYIWWHDYTIF